MKPKQIAQIIIAGLIFATSTYTYAKDPAQTINDAVNSLNSKMDEVHQLASQRRVNDAINKLDEFNKEVNHEVTWRTFDDVYREAKMKNRSFTFQVREDLPANMSTSFWQDYENRCDRMMAGRDQVLEGFIASTRLNLWDKALAYGQQLKTIYETFTGAAENVGTGNVPKLFYDLYGNYNDFKDNLKKVEKAKQDGEDISNMKADFYRLTANARTNKELYNKYKREIQSNIMVINDFNANIRYIKQLKYSADNGVLMPLSEADPKYSWDYGPYQREVEEVCDAMEDYVIKCAELEADVKEIINRGKAEWIQIKGNIQASDDEANKERVLNSHMRMLTDFEQVVDGKYQEAYQIYCIDNSASSNASNDNPFDGANASGQVENPSEPVIIIEEEEQDHDEDIVTDEDPDGEEAVDDSSTPNSDSEENNTSGVDPRETNIPSHAILIGWIENDGNGGGKYRSIEVQKLRSHDKIVFEMISGELNNTQVIWRHNSGSWETKINSKRTSFTVEEILEGINPNITHINFVVNAYHNRWRAGSIPCKMNVYHIPVGGEVTEQVQETSPNNTRPHTETNSEGRTNTNPAREEVVNTNTTSQFNDMLNKASEVFNRRDGNHTQEALTFLRKAERYIKQDPSLDNQINMLQRFASTCAGYGQKAFSYTDKAPFVILAAKAAHDLGSKASSVGASGSMTRAEAQKSAYAKAASAWRSVRGAATHGSHQYNTGYCDEQYQKYDELSQR